MTWHAGDLLNFAGMLVSGNPAISNPGPNGWFNTSVFTLLPAYTRRTNPWYYSDIRGPKFFNIDGTLNKDFTLTERIRFQLHMDAFNALNNMNWNDPNMTVGSSQFGKSTDIYPNDYGRRLQLGLRLQFLVVKRVGHRVLVACLFREVGAIPPKPPTPALGVRMALTELKLRSATPGSRLTGH